MFKVTCRKPIQQEHRYSMNMICLNESDEQHQPSCTARFTPAGSLRHGQTARLPVQDAQAVRRQPWDVTTKSLVALCAWTVSAIGLAPGCGPPMRHAQRRVTTALASSSWPNQASGPLAAATSVGCHTSLTSRKTPEPRAAKTEFE